MFKNVLSISLLALLGIGATSAAMANKNYKVSAAEPIETVDVFGETNYFSGNGGVWGGNSLSEVTEDDLTFKRLTNANGSDNGWLGMISEVKHAGTYEFSAMMRAADDYNDENIGFGFWAGGTINGRIHDTVISSQLVAGEWKLVTARFELTEAEATAIDSIHMWILQAGGHIDFYNMTFKQVFVGKLGENIFKDVGFENIDLSDGDRNGWNDRHSGKIGAADSQVLWTKEGADETYNQFLRLQYTGADGENNFADFCSFFNDWNGSWPAGIPAGEYFVEMDIRRNELFDTNNVGFGFYSSAATRIERDLTPQVKAATVDEWTHVTYRYPDLGVELTQAYADGVDTIQFWANTNGVVGAYLDIDNVSVRKVSLEVDERPEFDGGVYAFQWVEADGEDITITVSDLHGHTDLKILNGTYELEAGEEYTFDSVTGVLVITSDFLSAFDDGVETFVVQTSGGQRQFTIEITHIQEDLPDVSGYELEETVFGGDFQDLDLGYKMSEDQTEYAWGSVSLDDPGIVVEEDDGTRALELKPIEGSGKTYSSSFVIYHPEKIVENTIVTFSFDYKYNGAETDSGVDVCWVGSTNTSYHLIRLNGSKPAKTTEPAAKYRQWDIEYSEAANGYTHVEVSLRVDAATVTSTNSLRFLMKHNGDANQSLRITNVSLMKWVKSLGSLDSYTESFDKANQADVVVNATFAEGLEFYALAIDSKTNYVDEENFTVEENADGSYKITIKKEYLATLSNDIHTFYISSSENASGEYAELELTVNVFGTVSPDDSTPAKKKGCGGSILAASALISVTALIGVGLLAFKKKEK
mgnify:CR=1 FL=1